MDEAHKIGDNQRGVILQDAIERATRANPKLKAVFISPATQNPEELLTDAPMVYRPSPSIATSPPSFRTSWSRPRYRENRSSGRLLFDRREQHFRSGLFSSRARRMDSRSALRSSPRLSVRGWYARLPNGAGEAEEVADLISQLLPKLRPVDSGLLELAELARKGRAPGLSACTVS